MLRMERLASALLIVVCCGSLALNAQTVFEWIPRAPYPGTGYMGAFTFVLDGKGYVAGGYNGSNAVAEVWMYDPETDEWMARQSLPSARRHGTSWTMNGKGYVVCGFNGSSVRTNTLYEYDPVTDTWNVRAPLPGEARYGSHGFAIGSNGYVGGGNIGSASGPFLSDMWRYDSANNDWVEIEDERQLNPTKDALFIEGADSPYTNIVAARADRANGADIAKLMKALHTPEVKKFIQDKYKGAVVPAF